MGNSSSRADDWDSSEEGGSDYEHAYTYHTSVLRKSPTDGFESDYEDDDNDDVRSALRQLRSSSSKNDPSPLSPSVRQHPMMTDGSDGNSNSIDDGSVSLVTKQSTSGCSPAPVAAKGDSSSVGSCSKDQNESLPTSGKQQAADGGQGQSPRDMQQSVPDCRRQTSPTPGRQTSPSSSPPGGQTSPSAPPPGRQTSPSAPPPGRQTSPSSPTPGRQTSPSAPPPGRQTSPSSPTPGRQTSPSAPPPGRQTSPSAPPPGRQTLPSSPTAGRQTRQTGSVVEEEVYETAGEGDERDDNIDVNDDDSLSTITPPRTRPQSDSDRSLSEESDSEEDTDSEEEEEEECSDVEDSQYDTVTIENVASRSTRSSPAAQGQAGVSRSRASPRTTTSRSPPAPHRPLPRRHGRSPRSYRQSRKRLLTPEPDIPQKRNRPSDGINFSPNRTRFGIFDSESESDTARRGTKRPAPPPSSPPPLPDRTPPESRSLSARTLRQAARKAASQFVETSRKILRDAKTAARILRESTSKRRSSVALGEDEEVVERKRAVPVRRETRSSRGNPESSPSSRVSPATGQNRLKRKAGEGEEDREGPVRGRKRQQRMDVESDSDSAVEDVTNSRRSNSWRQVRKDGGRLRKFTRSATDSNPRASRQAAHSPPAQSVGNHSVSLPVLSGASSDRASAAPVRTSPRNAKLSNSFPSSNNPFQNVTLVPSVPKTQSSGSIDSISHELSPPTGSSTLNPFAILLTETASVSPPPLMFRAGSVWARINTSLNSALSGPSRMQSSPVPGTSGTRMSTRTSPQSTAAACPTRTSPRLAAHSLTGQFAQSGRFTFMLEDVLQVSVVTDNITTVTTKAIIIPTDALLQHTNPQAQSVAKAAGPGLAQACQNYLWQNADGLQVCQVMEGPAGGQLPRQVSRVLKVRTPDTEAFSAEEVQKQQKLLLCAYINCLKVASEKLGIASLTCPLLGSDSYPVHECIQVFFDSLIVYLAERTPTCPLKTVQLAVSNPAYCRFIAEVLEARLEAIATSSIDTAMAAVFRDYFNIPDFTRSVATQDTEQRSPSGKPAVKRRRL